MTAKYGFVSAERGNHAVATLCNPDSPTFAGQRGAINSKAASPEGPRENSRPVEAALPRGQLLIFSPYSAGALSFKPAGFLKAAVEMTAFLSSKADSISANFSYGCTVKSLWDLRLSSSINKSLLETAVRFDNA